MAELLTVPGRAQSPITHCAAARTGMGGQESIAITHRTWDSGVLADTEVPVWINGWPRLSPVSSAVLAVAELSGCRSEARVLSDAVCEQPANVEASRARDMADRERMIHEWGEGPRARLTSQQQDMTLASP